MKRALSATNEDVRVQVGRRLPSRRLAAVVVACAAFAVLGVGWLADNAASYVSSPSSGIMSRQAGLTLLTLSIAPAPLRASQPESFTVRVVDVAGKPVVGAVVRCALSMPTMDMSLAPSVATATTVAGDYSCGATLPHTGRWTLEVSIEAAGQPPTHTSFVVAAA